MEQQALDAVKAAEIAVSHWFCYTTQFSWCQVLKIALSNFFILTSFYFLKSINLKAFNPPIIMFVTLYRFSMFARFHLSKGGSVRTNRYVIRIIFSRSKYSFYYLPFHECSISIWISKGFYELLNPDLSGRPLKAPESTLSRRLFKSLDAFMFDLDQAHWA